MTKRNISLWNTSMLILLIGIFTSCNYGPGQNVQTIYIHDATDSLELFAPYIVSSPLNERDLAISPDGNEIFYTLSTLDNSFRSLVQIVQKNGKWQTPHIVSFSGKFNDLEPFFTPDGNRLYFSSDRPTNENDDNRDYNIWYVERNKSGWTTPEQVGDVVNTDYDEFYPAVTKNGNLYFTAHYPGHKGGEDIYKSEYKNGNYLPPHPLDSNINTKSYEFNAFVSPDEDIIIFSSYGREDGMGGGDLYISTKSNSIWQKAVNLGPGINSSKLDYCPYLDIKRGNFYFTSKRRDDIINAKRRKATLELFKAETSTIINGMGNIYKVSSKVLPLQ